MKRSGFTLIEILISAVILITGTLAMLGVLGDLLRKSSMPETVEMASQLAADRIQWFRAQADPYRAAGGTQYGPPPRGVSRDYNGDTTYNNNFNNNPTLFVREFLYTQTEGRFREAGLDAGRRTQRERITPGAPAAGTVTAGRNEIPPMPASGYHLVVPNRDGVPNSNDAEPENLTDLLERDTYRIPARRANNNIVSGSALPEDIAWVREVWVQTNHPRFPAGTAAFADSGLIPQPTIHQALPPYTVAVTVRVYPRIKAVKQFNLGVTPPPGKDYAVVGGVATGLGYRPNYPVSEMVGYFALRRERQ